MTFTDEQPVRHLQLEGTYNVRDVGGYVTTDGHVTRWRTLLRGDSLHCLTTEGQATLVATGLRTIIDLRRDRERTQAPNVFAASHEVRYRPIALVDDTLGTTEIPLSLNGITARILNGAHGQLRAVFAALSEPDAFPTLVHCTGGKDRTGVIIALLLGNAGVPIATIAADYALSEGYLAGAWMARMRAEVEAVGGNWSAMEPMMGSPEPLMRQTLMMLEEQYGSIPQYLRAIGVPDAQLAALRAVLRD